MSAQILTHPSLNEFEVKERWFAEQCDALIKDFNNFWPRQMEAHKQNELERAQDPDNPLRHLTEDEISNLSNLSPDVRRRMCLPGKGLDERVISALEEFNRRIDPRYLLDNRLNRQYALLTPRERLEMYETQTDKNSDRNLQGLLAWNSDRIYGWRYDFSAMSELILRLWVSLYLYLVLPPFD